MILSFHPPCFVDTLNARSCVARFEQASSDTRRLIPAVEAFHETLICCSHSSQNLKHHGKTAAWRAEVGGLTLIQAGGQQPLPAPVRNGFFNICHHVVHFSWCRQTGRSRVLPQQDDEQRNGGSVGRTVWTGHGPNNRAFCKTLPQAVAEFWSRTLEARFPVFRVFDGMLQGYFML
jgi:hypothetical protein